MVELIRTQMYIPASNLFFNSSSFNFALKLSFLCFSEVFVAVYSFLCVSCNWSVLPIRANRTDSNSLCKVAIFCLKGEWIDVKS